jgi:hypothetical protein
MQTPQVWLPWPRSDCRSRERDGPSVLAQPLLPVAAADDLPWPPHFAEFAATEPP